MSRAEKIKELELILFQQTPHLTQFATFLYDQGYEDVPMILALTEEEWTQMLDSVAEVRNPPPNYA